jgi:hypothetical protein
MLAQGFATSPAKAENNLATTPQPTITTVPTAEIHLWYIFQVEIAYRGVSGGVVKTATMRDKPSIYGATLGALNPYTKWWCDIYVTEGQNVWCKMSAQDAYIPLKYNGVYYTDWRE